MSVRNSIRFTVLLYNVQIVTETETQYASHKYQSSFKMPCENNGIANFTKILEHFRLKIWICHNISKLCLEIAKNSYKMYSYLLFELFMLQMKKKQNKTWLLLEYITFTTYTI